MLFELTRSRERAAAVAGDCKDPNAGRATNFSNDEIIFHNAQ
jgi:hypothetical protein